MDDRRREAARLYRDLGPVAYRASLSAFGSEEEAARATGEVFRKLARDLSPLASERGRALVHRAATEHCRSALRRRGRLPASATYAAGCPSPLELEEELASRVRGKDGVHAATCPACRERLAEMERAGEAFRREVYPGTVDEVMEAATAPWAAGWRRRAFMLLPLGGLAATALLLILFAPHLASDDMGPKRAPLGLAVYAAGAAVPIHDGARAPPGAELRFRVRSSRPCRLWLVAADEGGVLQVFPGPGDAPVVEGTSALPRTARVEPGTGPLRFYAVCGDDTVSGPDVERSVRAATAGGAKAVRRGGMLLGLPPGTLEATVLLERGS